MYAPSHVLGIALPANLRTASDTAVPIGSLQQEQTATWTTIQSLRWLQLSTSSSSLHFIPAFIQEGNSFLTAKLCLRMLQPPYTRP